MPPPAIRYMYRHDHIHLAILMLQERIKRGGRACNCTSWLWSRRKCSFMPKYTFHSRPQTYCEVFKWMLSITALTTDWWLANHELITHTHSELLEVLQLTGFILNLGTPINFRPERARCYVVTRSSSLCALVVINDHACMHAPYLQRQFFD